MTNLDSAVKGALVLCPSGHVICELGEDLAAAPPNEWARAFINWRQPEPMVGRLEPIVCAVCGAEVWSGNGESKFVFRQHSLE